VSADVLAKGSTRLPLLRVPYEDFLRRPAYWLDSIARFVGEDDVSLPALDQESVELRPSHTVTGNRARFRTGAVRLSPDTDWVENLHPADTLMSTLLTLPLLRRYGYPIRRPGRRRLERV
jgi:hypothetical protein